MRLTFGWDAPEEPDLVARAERPDGLSVIVVRAPAASIGGEPGPVLIDGHSTGRILVVLAEEMLAQFAPEPDDSVERMAAKMSLLSSVIGDAVGRGIAAAEEQGRL